MGTIPASLDRVAAGDAQRLSNRACKVLIFLGADDGSIPQVTPGQGLLTDRYLHGIPEDSRVKVELGLCKGKKLHDKRDSEADRESKRDIDRAMKERNYS